MFAEWKARDGAISGGIKPVLKDVTIRPTEDSLGNKLKAWVADTGLHLFSDRVPGRNAAATVVPIEGRLDHPGHSALAHDHGRHSQCVRRRCLGGVFQPAPRGGV